MSKFNELTHILQESVSFPFNVEVVVYTVAKNVDSGNCCCIHKNTGKDSKKPQGPIKTAPVNTCSVQYIYQPNTVNQTCKSNQPH